MQTSLLDQGLTLMLVGMGTVFVFLTLLVIVMSIMASIASRFVAPETSTSSAVSAEEVAAIAAAITQHQSKESRKQ